MKKNMRKKANFPSMIEIVRYAWSAQHARRFIQNNNFLLINLKTNCLIKEMKCKRRIGQLHFIFRVCHFSSVDWPDIVCI